MKGIFLIMLATISLTAHSLTKSVQDENKNSSNVEHLTAGKYQDGEINLAYDSYDFLIRSLEAERDEKLWSKETFEEKKAKIPRGGILKFDIKQKDEKAANAANIKVVIKDMAGHFLYKGMMKSKKPKKSGKYWTAQKWVRMTDTRLPNKFKVSIMNNVTENRYDYVVDVAD